MKSMQSNLPRNLRSPYLEDILLGALEVFEAPLIDCTIHSSRHQLGVIWQPGHTPHLAIMAPAQKLSIMDTCPESDTDSRTDMLIPLPCHFGLCLEVFNHANMP